MVFCSGSLLCRFSRFAGFRRFNNLLCRLRRQDDLYFSRQHQLVDTRTVRIADTEADGMGAGLGISRNGQMVLAVCAVVCDGEILIGIGGDILPVPLPACRELHAADTIFACNIRSDGERLARIYRGAQDIQRTGVFPYRPAWSVQKKRLQFRRESQSGYS